MDDPMKIHPIQAMLDGFGCAMERKRSETQMTLGKMIATLEDMAPDSAIQSLDGVHSYRGYYSDLAFELVDGVETTAGALLEMCRSCMGQSFEGYKGGTFWMSGATPLWISSYGHSSGTRIMAILPDGTIQTSPEPELELPSAPSETDDE